MNKNLKFSYLLPTPITQKNLSTFNNLHSKISGDKVIELFKKGNKIYIKKKNRGSFAKSAKRAGMGVQEYANHILANKDKYSTTLVKRANFARNASKWKK